MSKILTSIRLNSYWSSYWKNSTKTLKMLKILHVCTCIWIHKYFITQHVMILSNIIPIYFIEKKSTPLTDVCTYLLVYAGCFVTNYQPIKTVGSTMEWSIRLPLVLLKPCLCINVFRRINLILGYSSSHVFQFYLHKLLNNTFEVNFPRGVQQNI